MVSSGCGCGRIVVLDITFMELLLVACLLPVLSATTAVQGETAENMYARLAGGNEALAVPRGAFNQPSLRTIRSCGSSNLLKLTLAFDTSLLDLLTRDYGCDSIWPIAIVRTILCQLAKVSYKCHYEEFIPDGFGPN